ncbi:C40 family peptidase [Leifsonia poae]|uniref:C40 family peptidase n=1 Tax=Leifsonia poae TaxID=110933 RepID=UPI001CBF4AC2|nr:C40 family peptidase [Leifsonia poae]
MAQLGTPGSEEDPSTNPNRSTTGSTSDLVSRRSLRAERVAPVSNSARTVEPAAASPAAKPAKPAAKKKIKGGVINVAVMTLAAGLIATMAIPAYAFNPQGADGAQFKASAIDGMKKAQSQSVEVPQTVAAASVARDTSSATTEEQLATQKAAEAARQRAAVSLASYASSYSGPSVTDFLANPPYPKFSLSQVFSVAQQYIGTPYVFGGSTPAGFDCSGYIMFVYAQFGISLPHSVSGQAARGTRISIQDAVPGDVVIMPGHDGFYAGNGNIMDAPDTGRSISIRPIWTSDYYIVRLGI